VLIYYYAAGANLQRISIIVQSVQTKDQGCHILFRFKNKNCDTPSKRKKYMTKAKQ
jgi:hypothetical protein